RGTGKGMAAAAMLAAYPRPDRPLSRLRCAPRDPEDLARELDAAQRRWRREARGDAGRADGAGGEGGREDDGREDGGSENEGREAAGRADAGTDSGGAETQSPGLGETLLLEMACTLPPGLQSRVLRLLDIAAGAGGGPGGAARLRLICSTRDDLEQRVADGQFRETLHHRLSIARLRLPPLRERGEDVIELAELRLAARAPGFRGLHPELRRALLEHPWPRNSAQLTATTVALAERLDDGWATPAGLPEDFLATRLRPRAAATGRKTARAAPGPEAPAAEPSDPSTLGARVAPLVGLTVAEVEAALVEATLARCAGSVAEASRILGISPATLYRRRARRDARIALRSGDAAAAALNAAGAGPGESSGEASPGAPDAGADADP
ncbi:MAG: helix-turn-helix domain-containing protein, partial [Pseudomonadota bacterium]